MISQRFNKPFIALHAQFGTHAYKICKSLHIKDFEIGQSAIAQLVRLISKLFLQSEIARSRFMPFFVLESEYLLLSLNLMAQLFFCGKVGEILRCEELLVVFEDGITRYIGTRL